MDSLTTHVKKIGYLFYIASPNETTFRTVQEVPHYYNEFLPYFFVMVMLEISIRLYQNKGIRWNDAINSSSHGLIYVIMIHLTKGIEFLGYDWLYQRRLIDLDWSSPVTWCVAALCADFAYYWLHRFIHEVMVGWAAHQLHHSSEDYNLTTAFRIPILQKFFSFGLYLPCALIGVPLPAMLVHTQMNMLYQFGIHTELISTLGPLEWILNTPSHHRVHHGSEPWCLDKNYGGVLIIWDRMFGTFQAEKPGVQITYGLVNQPQTFNIIKHQLFYYEYIFRKAASMNTWSKFFKVLLYSPSFNPDTEDQKDDITPKELAVKSDQVNNNVVEEQVTKVQEKVPRKKYDPQVSPLMEAYLIAHFFASLLFQQIIMNRFHEFSPLSAMLHMLYLLVSVGNIAAMYDGWGGAIALEAARCAAYVLVSTFYSFSDYFLLNAVVIGYNCFSTVLWTVCSIRTMLKSQIKHE